MNPQQPDPPQNSANNNFTSPQPQNFINPSAGPPSPAPGQYSLIPEPASKSKKGLFAVLAAVIVLLAGTGAYALFFYLPNRPENVWKTGLDRSGDVLEELTTKAATAEQVEKLERSEFTGSVSVESENAGGFNADLNVKFDALKVIAEGNLKTDLTGQEDINIMLDLLSEAAEGSRFPDMYFRISGIRDLGPSLSLWSPVVEYDGKWIAISSEFLEKQAGSGLGGTPKENEEVTAQEISEAVGVVTETSREYIFTSDPEKAVLELKRFVGKEDVEGVDSYHYRAAINQDNAVEFCEVLTERVMRTEAAKKLAGDLTDEEIEQQKADCGEARQDADDEFGVWVDSKYKLINRLRFYDEDETHYFDIGQNYTGGDEVPFYVDFSKSYEGLTEGRVTITANLETLNTKGELKLSGKSGSDPWTANASLQYKPYNETFEVKPPPGATDIEDVINDFIQSPAVDSSATLGDDTVLGADSTAKSSRRELLEVLKSLLPVR